MIYIHVHVCVSNNLLIATPPALFWVWNFYQ